VVYYAINEYDEYLKNIINACFTFRGLRKYENRPHPKPICRQFSGLFFFCNFWVVFLSRLEKLLRKLINVQIKYLLGIFCFQKVMHIKII